MYEHEAEFSILINNQNIWRYLDSIVILILIRKKKSY